MKILVLEQGTKERSLIQQVLQAGSHDVVLAEDAEQAWKLIHTGEVRFVIADVESSDVIASQLVHRARTAGIPSVYFLLLTSHEISLTEADDILHKPFKAVDLQSRLVIGQRILTMGDSLSQARDQLESTAMYDPLTGMMNRTAFNRLAKSELERARRASSTLSVIALEIDNFQAISDRHGVEAGNRVLKLVAASIRERSRSYDCVGRWTGPEFMIALIDVTGPAAELIARRIVTGIRFMNLNHEGAALELNVSAGISSAASISESTQLELLIQAARQALARAKESGGYQVVLAKP